MTVELYLRAPNEKRRPPPGMAAVVHLDEPGRSGYPLHHNLARLPAVSRAAGSGGFGLSAGGPGSLGGGQACGAPRHPRCLDPADHA